MARARRKSRNRFASVTTRYTFTQKRYTKSSQSRAGRNYLACGSWVHSEDLSRRGLHGRSPRRPLLAVAKDERADEPRHKLGAGAHAKSGVDPLHVSVDRVLA